MGESAGLLNNQIGQVTWPAVIEIPIQSLPDLTQISDVKARQEPPYWVLDTKPASVTLRPTTRKGKAVGGAKSLSVQSLAGDIPVPTGTMQPTPAGGMLNIGEKAWYVAYNNNAVQLAALKTFQDTQKVIPTTSQENSLVASQTVSLVALQTQQLQGLSNMIGRYRAAGASQTSYQAELNGFQATMNSQFAQLQRYNAQDWTDLRKSLGQTPAPTAPTPMPPTQAPSLPPTPPTPPTQSPFPQISLGNARINWAIQNNQQQLAALQAFQTSQKLPGSIPEQDSMIATQTAELSKLQNQQVGQLFAVRDTYDAMTPSTEQQALYLRELQDVVDNHFELFSNLRTKTSEEWASFLASRGASKPPTPFSFPPTPFTAPPTPFSLPPTPFFPPGPTLPPAPSPSPPAPSTSLGAQRLEWARQNNFVQLAELQSYQASKKLPGLIPRQENMIASQIASLQSIQNHQMQGISNIRTKYKSSPDLFNYQRELDNFVAQETALFNRLKGITSNQWAAFLGNRRSALSADLVSPVIISVKKAQAQADLFQSQLDTLKIVQDKHMQELAALDAKYVGRPNAPKFRSDLSALAVVQATEMRDLTLAQNQSWNLPISG